MKVILCKWVLEPKRNADGEAVKYKARFVVFGNLDEDDLSCTFAPLVDFTVIR